MPGSRSLWPVLTCLLETHCFTRRIVAELLRPIAGAYLLVSLALFALIALLAWFLGRRGKKSNVAEVSSAEPRHGARRLDRPPIADETIDDVHAAPCQIVEPRLGTLGAGEEDATAAQFTLETWAGRINYSIALSYKRDTSSDRLLQHSGGRLRAITAVYEMRIRRDRGAAMLVGTVRLGLDGRGKLSRVAVQKLKPTYPQVQAAARDWLLGFVGQEFSYRVLLTTTPRSSRRVI
jgi:hypothetical protein